MAFSEDHQRLQKARGVIRAKGQRRADLQRIAFGTRGRDQNPAVAQPDAPVGDIWARYEHPTAYRVLVRTAQNDYLYVCLDGGCEYTEQEAETLRSAVYARGGSAVVVTPRGHVPGGASVAARPGWGGYPANGPTPRPMDDDKTLARVTLQATAGGK